MRFVVCGSGLLIAAAAIAGCGGGGSSQDQPPVVASCRNLEELASYRYSIDIKINVPAPDSSAQATPGSPLSAFSGTLNALLSDFTIDGAHLAPDRTDAKLRFEQDEIELRAIGDQAWKRLGDKWQQEDDPGVETELLTPTVVCEDRVETLAPLFEGVDSSRETVNGVEADHYHLDETNIVLPTSVAAVVPQGYRVDMWLAHDGRWPVRLEIEAPATDEHLFMDLRDINDRGISIEPPVISSSGS